MEKAWEETEILLSFGHSVTTIPPWADCILKSRSFGQSRMRITDSWSLQMIRVSKLGLVNTAFDPVFSNRQTMNRRQGSFGRTCKESDGTCGTLRVKLMRLLRSPASK